jgi:hypothetical protein
VARGPLLLIVLLALASGINGIVPPAHAQVGVTPQAEIARERIAISSISPSSGPQGTIVTITGTGFTSSNTINFSRDGQSFTVGSPVASLNGTSLQFHLTSCPSYALQCPGHFIAPGAYDVSALNANGRSNEMTFTVTPLR